MPAQMVKKEPFRVGHRRFLRCLCLAGVSQILTFAQGGIKDISGSAAATTWQETERSTTVVSLDDTVVLLDL
jgi:hypothetical protein